MGDWRGCIGTMSEDAAMPKTGVFAGEWSDLQAAASLTMAQAAPVGIAACILSAKMVWYPSHTALPGSKATQFIVVDWSWPNLAGPVPHTGNWPCWISNSCATELS